MSAKDLFSERGYVVLRGAVDPTLVQFVTQYALFDEEQDFLPEGTGTQVPRAHTKYADPAMETMLLHIHPLIEEATGLTVVPTYSYYRVYRNGDELAPHKDRPSCEISATMCFDFSYRQDEFRWPIYMDGNAVNMEPGDLVV